MERLLEKLVEEEKNMKKGFVRNVLIEFNADDPLNIEKMRIIDRGKLHSFENQNPEEFDNVPLNSFPFMIDVDPTYSSQQLRKRLEFATYKKLVYLEEQTSKSE